MFIVERYNLWYIKRFVVEFMDSIIILSNGVRVGMVLFDFVGLIVFKLNIYIFLVFVWNVIELILEMVGFGYLVDKGLI